MWALLITLHIKDIPTQKFSEEFVKPTYCVMRAKQFWHNFYEMGYASGTMLETICVSKKNPYDVIVVKCTKEDLCNV
jgi:hypothetical protein